MTTCFSVNPFEISLEISMKGFGTVDNITTKHT